MSMNKCTRFLSIHIFLVFGLFGFVYIVTIFDFIDELLGLQSFAGLLNALIFTLLALLCGFSFLVCVLTDPGQVPSPYVPDMEENEASPDQNQKTGAHLRSCDQCNAYKPPRAHHCRICRRCILKMDHHCIWINNCVGHWNYKAFVLLVFYAAVASIYSTAIIISCVRDKDWDLSERGSRTIFIVFTWPPLLMLYYVQNLNEQQESPERGKFAGSFISCLRNYLIITCGAVLVLLSLTLGTLLAWHIYLVACNMTTIEYREGIRAAWLARKSGRNYHHPYNVGLYKNFTLVLGTNMLKWLCPSAVSHVKDGTSFPTSRDDS